MKPEAAWPSEPTTLPAMLVHAAVRLLSPLWRALGADPRQLGILVGTWLALDERRGKSSSAEAAPPASMLSRGLLLTLAFDLVIGTLAALALGFFEDPVIGFAIAQGAALVMVTATLITDYSAALLDDTDVGLIAPLPVDGRTFLLARLAHIGAYLSLIVGCLTLPGLIVGCLSHPPLAFAVAWTVASVGTGLLGLGFAFGGFLIAARWLDPERFADLQVWLQVILSVVFIGGVQFAPLWLEATGANRAAVAPAWLAWVLPPCHATGVFALLGDDGDARAVGLTGLAVLLPCLSLAALVTLGRRGLLQSLSSRAVGARVARRVRGSSRMRSAPAVWRAGHDWFAAVSGRDRLYRLRTWSAVAAGLVVGIAIAFGQRLDRPPEAACGALYIVGAYSAVFFVHARQSADWQARWLIESAPLANPSAFLDGAWRALLARRLLPAYACVALVVIAVAGIPVVPHVAFASGMVGLLVAMFARWFVAEIPFSREPAKKAQGGVIAILLLGMFGAAAFSGVHLVLHIVSPVAIDVGAFITLPIAAVALRSVRARPVPVQFH